MKISLPEHFTPKSFSAFLEGYSLDKLRCDAVAGLTVAIVALPLSMAIAIASHAPPERGLYTAIIGGFLISLLSGSRFQIGGPAGAFIVLVAAIIDKGGMQALLFVTLSSGLLLTLIGLLKLGSYIRYVPHPVTVGFTTGIALIIAISQVKDFFGLKLSGPEPSELPDKIIELAKALPSWNPSAAILSLGCVGLILVFRRLRPHWPGFLIAVAAASAAAALLPLNVETIATRFGGLPRSLPAPSWPVISFAQVRSFIPDILAVTLLGGIESLLSAVVADSMSGRRHRPNMELIAQGIANIGTALFGGITATGTIARTATNVRAGATGPVSGMLHSLFLLLFIMLAAPLAGYIPLAALAAILMIVAWNMAEREEFVRLLKSSRGDAAVLLTTFLLVLFADLSIGIAAGVVLGSLLFMHRMSETISIETHHSGSKDGGQDYQVPPGVILFRISGAFFFAAASTVETALSRINDKPRAFVLDLEEVPVVDSSAAHALKAFVIQAEKQGAPVYVAGASKTVMEGLAINGLSSLHYSPSASHCLEMLAKDG